MDLAADLNKTSRRTIDHNVCDFIAREQRFEWTKPEDIVTDIIEQIFLLGDGQHQILDRYNFMHDIANFFARAFGIELGQRREIDRLDQSAKNERFRLKIGL